MDEKWTAGSLWKDLTRSRVLLAPPERIKDPNNGIEFFWSCIIQLMVPAEISECYLFKAAKQGDDRET